ncbi:hypothetical protein B0H19DRAFT_1253400 [Mycena capillaripes]|nr:hypothetical protein B0H19DRAFT_1253400 [Mycena capillaripes]
MFDVQNCLTVATWTAPHGTGIFIIFILVAAFLLLLLLTYRSMLTTTFIYISLGTFTVLAQALLPTLPTSQASGATQVPTATAVSVISSLFLPPTSTNPPLLPTLTSSIQPISGSTGAFQLFVPHNMHLMTAACDRIHRTINQLSRIVDFNGLGSADLRVYRRTINQLSRIIDSNGLSSAYLRVYRRTVNQLSHIVDFSGLGSAYFRICRTHLTINQLSHIVDFDGFGSAYLRVYSTVLRSSSMGHVPSISTGANFMSMDPTGRPISTVPLVPTSTPNDGEGGAPVPGGADPPPVAGGTSHGTPSITDGGVRPLSPAPAGPDVPPAPGGTNVGLSSMTASTSEDAAPQAPVSPVGVDVPPPLGGATDVAAVVPPTAAAVATSPPGLPPSADPVLPPTSVDAILSPTSMGAATPSTATAPLISSTSEADIPPVPTGSGVPPAPRGLKNVFLSADSFEYSAGWAVSTGPVPSCVESHHVHQASTMDATFSFNFSGDSLFLNFLTSPSGGVLELSINSGTFETFNITAPAASCALVSLNVTSLVKRSRMRRGDAGIDAQNQCIGKCVSGTTAIDGATYRQASSSIRARGGGPGAGVFMGAAMIVLALLG